MELDRAHPAKAIYAILKWLITTPSITLAGLGFIAKKTWRMKGALLRGRAKPTKLTFFIQNFMDASTLEKDRVHACSFMVMTGNGPISMCLHNAKRDEFILAPIALTAEPGKTWDPLTGKTTATPATVA